jgi:hypothetical protein
MSKTRKSYCQLYHKEPTWTRRYSWRKYRAKCRQLLREGRHEMPRFRGTEGWAYW